MDITKKAILFDGTAVVNVLDTTEMVQQAIDFHKTSDIASEALGKVLTMGAFISGNFKGKNNKLTIIVQGGGPLGKIVVCGDYGAKMRGYVENPFVEGKTVKEVIGSQGYLNIIKDFNMKEPYNGLSQLVNGNIGEDFAYYFTTSEQLPTALAINTKVKNGKCIKSGGIIIQAMPNCQEEVLVILEDIVRDFEDVCSQLEEKGPEGIISYYFGHFNMKYIDDSFPEYRCSCSTQKIDEMLISLGEKEALNILKEEGKIEVNCQFCDKKYVYKREDIDRVFHGSC